MKLSMKVFIVLIAVAMHGSPANAQGLLTVREVSLGMALEIAQGALEACRKLDAHIGVSVVDRGGHVLVTLRDDGAAHHTVETRAAQGLHRPHLSSDDTRIRRAHH
jgi:hypothetical protein